MSPAKKATKSTAASKASKGFTAEEKAAMKERSRELKAAKEGAAGEADALSKIAALKEPERGMAKKLHALIKTSAPSLMAKTWYGMPAYANQDGKIVLFFQSAQKFNTRYATLGFNDSAQLDDGNFWPVAYALKELNAAEEAKIAALVKKAVG